MYAHQEQSLFINLLTLEMLVSRKVVFVSDTSAVNFIVGWRLFARRSMNCAIPPLFIVFIE